MSTRIISVSNHDLLKEADDSNLKSTANAAATTLSVYSITAFAINKVLLIDEIGNEMAEIVKTSSSSAPSGTTVTLNSALVKTHPADTKVYIVLFDEIEFSYASTETGSKTALATSNIDPEREETVYTDTGHTSGYYFTRYYNSITGTYSDYSDPIPYVGFASDTVNYIIGLAMGETQKEYTLKLTYDLLVSEINECLRFVRGKLKRWSHNQIVDYSLGVTVDTQVEYDLPDDYYNPNSPQSTLDIRVDGESILNHYVEKREFDILSNEAGTGTPQYWTIYNGQVALYPTPDSTTAGLDILLDYYTEITEVDSDADVIPDNRYDMVKHWLKWVIRSVTERNGRRDLSDPDYILFLTILQDAIRREDNGQKFKMKPKVNRISYNSIGRQSIDEFLSS